MLNVQEDIVPLHCKDIDDWNKVDFYSIGKYR